MQVTCAHCFLIDLNLFGYNKTTRRRIMKNFSSKRFVLAVCVCLILNTNVASAVVRRFCLVTKIITSSFTDSNHLCLQFSFVMNSIDIISDE